MTLPFKVCPECGAEHVHTALVCEDCNVGLEIAPIGTGEPLATAPLPPASELTRVAAGGAWEMERLALALQEAGLSSRIDSVPPAQPSSRHVAAAARRGSSGSGARLGLYVLPVDEEPARRVIQSVLLQDGVGDVSPGTERDTLEACPACGAPISGVSSACSDCGLEFVPVEDVCSRCGAVLTGDATVCQSCGARASPKGVA